MPEETAAAIVDGWLHTGDLVTVNADGTYTFVSRRKEVLRRRGQNLSPAEVEDAIQSHPDVFEVAVVGSSELSEEEVKAFVVAEPGRELDFERRGSGRLPGCPRSRSRGSGSLWRPCRALRRRGWPSTSSRRVIRPTSTTHNSASDPRARTDHDRVPGRGRPLSAPDSAIPCTGTVIRERPCCCRLLPRSSSSVRTCACSRRSGASTRTSSVARRRSTVPACAAQPFVTWAFPWTSERLRTAGPYGGSARAHRRGDATPGRAGHLPAPRRRGGLPAAGPAAG